MNKTTKDLRLEVRTQFRSIICITTMLLIKQGYNIDKIEDTMREYAKIWEQSQSSGAVMLQMCERETGIELQLDGDKSFHDYKSLNFNSNGGRALTNKQIIMINSLRKRWVPTMCLASICIALHRVLDFDTEQISVMMCDIDAERKKMLPMVKYMRDMEQAGMDYLLKVESA